MDNQNKFPCHFNSEACKTCGGKCCRGSRGYVWISMKELKEMARIKQMEPDAFCKQYVRQVQGRISLKERAINGEHFCCFFDPIDCQCNVYESRPRQCRDFPFWNQFKKNPKDLLLVCPGVSLK